MASVLSGATISQLRHWRRPNRKGTLVEPVMAGGRALYTFEDVVALRMFVHLRQRVSLQKVRVGIANVLKHQPGTHPSEHKLEAYPSGESIVWITDDGEFVDVVDKPGHTAIKVVLADVFGEFTTESGRVVPDLQEPAPGISIDQDVRGGYPVLNGTRLPFDAVAGLARDGLTDEQIAAIYPTASPQGIAGARQLAELVERDTSAA